MLTEQRPALPAPLASPIPGEGIPGRLASLESQVAALRNQNVALIDAMRQWADTLNRDGALHIYQAKILASHGIDFPATQNPSTDPNTLDDYEEGAWTPAITFSTPGDLSVAYAGFRQGDYTKIGREVIARFNIVTSTFTHTTASGSLQITGLPFTNTSDSNANCWGSVFWSGITKATYTQVVPFVPVGDNKIQFVASGSGVVGDDVDFADAPTGGTPVLRGFVVYRV